MQIGICILGFWDIGIWIAYLHYHRLSVGRSCQEGSSFRTCWLWWCWWSTLGDTIFDDHDQGLIIIFYPQVAAVKRDPVLGHARGDRGLQTGSRPGTKTDHIQVQLNAKKTGCVPFPNALNVSPTFNTGGSSYVLNSRPNIDAELGLITLRLQKQELGEVFSFFILKL